MKKQFENICIHLIRVFVKFLGIIPKNMGTRLGAFLGRIIFIIDKRHRNIAIENLTHAFKDEKDSAEIRQCAVKVFENMGKIPFETCWSWNRDIKELSRDIKLEGLHNLRHAFEKGRGVLILTAHFGNWELLTAAAAMTGYPVSIIYRPLDFKPLDDFVKSFRTRFGAKLIHRRKAIRRVLRTLNKNEMTAILLDQSVDWYEGVFVDFFGRPACTNKGMALLALKTGSPVVPVFLARDEQSFTAKIFPEIPLVQTGDKIRDIEINTEKYNHMIEYVIRQYPEQWFWVHRRWKTLPYVLWPKK